MPSSGSVTQLEHAQGFDAPPTHEHPVFAHRDSDAATQVMADPRPIYLANFGDYSISGSPAHRNVQVWRTSRYG